MAASLRFFKEVQERVLEEEQSNSSGLFTTLTLTPPDLKNAHAPHLGGNGESDSTAPTSPTPTSLTP